MVISSNTPEGAPHRCPVCGNVSLVEPSLNTDDSCCPRCGQLLWWFRDRLSRYADIDPARITLETSFIDEVEADSLDFAELVIAMEEEFGITIPADEAERIKTVGDAIRYIEWYVRKY